MLPIPFENFIPSFFTRDDKLTALSDKTDEMLEEWKQDVLDLNKIIDPVRIPSLYLDDLGDYLNANLLDTDTDRQKRKKIVSAIESHKNNGTWADDIKPKIDNLIGGDASLYSSIDSDDFIVMGGESSEPDYYWATMGVDGIDDDLGIAVIGEGDEVEIAGNIYIDVDDSTLTFAEVETLKDTLDGSIPAYYAIYLGYTSGGIFYTYINGVIGKDRTVVFLGTSTGVILANSNGKKLVSYVKEN